VQPPPLEQQMAAAGQRHKHKTKPISAKVVTSIIDGLKQIYFHKVCVCGLQVAVVILKDQGTACLDSTHLYTRI
jgi:hypothetical protein